MRLTALGLSSPWSLHPLHHAAAERGGREIKRSLRYITRLIRAPKAEAPRTTEAEIALDRDAPLETESDLREELNLVCNRALRSMLRDDLLQVRAVKEDLNVLGASFAAQDNLKAALFCYVLMQMTSHVIPKQAEGLQGSYKAAFEKLYVLLEDSGWELQPEEEESEVAGDS